MRKSLCLLYLLSLRKTKVSNFLLLFAAFCSALLITSGHPMEVENCGVVKYPRSGIVGGNIAQDGAYPWMVSIHKYGRLYKHHCGASIINEHWILTAAHCVYYHNQPHKYVAIVGLHKLSKKDRPLSRSHQISKIIVHEGYYTSWKNTHDIALLRTAEPIDIAFSRGYVNGICLPDSDEDPEGWAIVTGWGDTYYRERKKSEELQTVLVPIIPRKTCSIAYDKNPRDGINENIPDTQICAGDTFKDSCQGDSGGPLVQRDRNGVYTLIGIVSYGSGCGEKDIPGVYTKVASYIEWMEANMKN